IEVVVAVSGIGGEQFNAEFQKVLTRVIEIHNLDRTGEVFIGDIPDPWSPIADYDLPLRPIPAATMRFGIHASAKRCGRFNRSSVGCRIVIAYWTSFLVGGGLGKDTAQLNVSVTSWLSFGL